MKITIINTQRVLSFSLQSLKKMIAKLMEKLEIRSDEVIIHLVSKKKICQLHQKFFNDPSPTDCISFPLDRPQLRAKDYQILGEIFVCPEVAIEYATKNGKDSHEESLLYIIHGLLHLVGYDDIDELSRKEMRKAEKKCLKIAATLDPNSSWKKNTKQTKKKSVF